MKEALIMQDLSHYAKSLAYIAISLFGVLGAALTDGHITQSELVNIGIVLVGAVGVYWAPNLAGTVLSRFKGFVAFLVAALVALQPFVLTGQMTASEWLQVAVAAFAGIGVVIVPNSPADLGAKP